VGWGIRGLIEGFYGPPWSWEDRRMVMRWCHERGMTDYLYAPKDDPLHRERWREPYPDDEIRAFEGLVEEGSLRVGFAVSPGLSIDYHSPDDRAALAAKIDRMVEVGIGLVCLALDDIAPRPGLGVDHASLTAWLADHLGSEVPLVLVPTEYTGTTSTPYLDALAAGVPPEVAIAWTGRTVVCDTITVAEAEARSASLGGRPPLVWDNYPVNDAIMSDRLFLGPFKGRDLGLSEACAGLLANPMVQPRASLLPLTSIAAYLRGDDAHEAWREEAEKLGIVAFAESCDGRAPYDLVRRLVASTPATRPHALAAIETWLAEVEASMAAADALGAELAPWTGQLTDEIGLWNAALALLDHLDERKPSEASVQALALAYLWPPVRRGIPSVMGPRCSFRPVIGQDGSGEWIYHQGSLTEDANATDALVRFALQRMGDAAQS
jgi:hyaluronoglucosaminidase